MFTVQGPTEKVVVVGAGLAGLSTAMRLAGAGREVVVLEREDRPGGRAGRLEMGGYSFDTGPTVLTMVDLIDDGLARTNTRPFNFTLLHLLRRAAAEQGCRATQCRACGGNSLFVAGRFGHLPHGKECGYEFSDIRRDEPDEYPMFHRITEENRP